MNVRMMVVCASRCVPSRNYLVRSSTACTILKRSIASLKEVCPSSILAKAPIKLKSRKYLPGSDYPTMPGSLEAAVKPYVKCFVAEKETADLSDIGHAIKAVVDEELNTHGALIFHRLPLSTAGQVNEVAEAMGFEMMTYKYGTGYRNRLQGVVYEASAEDPRYTIELHNEMSYMPEFPSKLIFTCLRPADVGGEVVIAANRDIAPAISKKYIDKVRTKKIRYIRNLFNKETSNYITWQNIFECNTKEDCERAMREKGIEWQWMPGDILQMWNIVGGLINLERTGEEVWFNQAASNHCSYYSSHPMFDDGKARSSLDYPFHAQYGDGEEFEDELLHQIRTASWKCATAFSLQPGDMIFLDNHLIQHARMSYLGDRLLSAVLLR